MIMNKVIVIGAGLAGCEAAITLAQNGYKVQLVDMKPEKRSPAHTLDGPAEIVCSNSLGAEEITTGAGLFKEEMKLLGVNLLEFAYGSRVEAGRALAVDRDIFSELVTKRLIELDVDIVNKEIEDFPIKSDSPVIYATGPLTSDGLAANMLEYFGEKKFFFYDAIAPVIYEDSIDYSRAFIGGRYQTDAGDYINCPMTQEEYYRFYEALINAEQHPMKDFEKKKFFEGCMPVEEIASRGPKTLVFGPMRPVGFEHYIDYKPKAVLQLRKDNKSGTMYNMVGFQTNLKYGEQKRVFRLIPGLEKARFARHGRMHKNIYVNTPEKLDEQLKVKGLNNIYIAGQLTGVEGYLESIFTGWYAARCIIDKKRPFLPLDSMSGALIDYILNFDGKRFQPMNVNFGLLPPPADKIKDKKLKKKTMAERALASIEREIS